MVTTSHDYQAGVTATIQNLAKGLSDADEFDAWLNFFANSCVSTCSKVALFQREVSALQTRWLAQLAPRSDSAVTLLVRALPAIPLFSASSAAAYLDRSFKRTTTAIAALESAGIIKQMNRGKRNRLFECPEIVDAYAHIKGFQ